MSQQNQQMQRANDGDNQQALSPVQVLRKGLAEKRSIILALLSEHADHAPQTDRIFAVAAAKYAAMVKSSSKPLDPLSAIDCVHQAALLGLEAGSDQAYLVPYKGKIQLIVSPRGLIDLAFRHPAVADVDAEVVRKGDEFEYMLGDKPFIKHRKGDTVDQKGADLLFAYAVIHLVNGGTIRSVLTAAEVKFYRSFSKADSGPWFDNTAAMWRKTALKRAFAKGPRSAQMAAALQENDHGHYVPPTIADGTDPNDFDAHTGEVTAPAQEPARQATARVIVDMKPQAAPLTFVQVFDAAVIAGKLAADTKNSDGWKAARVKLIADCQALNMADVHIKAALERFKAATSASPTVKSTSPRESGDDTDAERAANIDRGAA